MSSVPEALRSQRQRLGQSPVGAAVAARLPDHVPAALESGELPLDDATTLAYVRIYARHLGLDAEELLRDCAVDEPLELDDGPMLRPPPARGHRLRASRVRVALVLAILGVGCLVFAASIVRNDAGGPVDVQLGAPASSEATGTDEGPGRSAAGADDSRFGSPTQDDRERSEAPDRSDADEPPGAGDAVPGDAVAGDAAPRAAGPGAAVPGPVDPAGSEAPAPGTATSLPGRAPEETRVQLLHHASIAQATVEQVHAVLQSLGYQVTHVNLLVTPVDDTTVHAVEGWMAEAEALRQRDPRFANVTPNQAFSIEVDLHVVIGTDWPGQD